MRVMEPSRFLRSLPIKVKIYFLAERKKKYKSDNEEKQESLFFISAGYLLFLSRCAALAAAPQASSILNISSVVFNPSEKSDQFGDQPSKYLKIWEARKKRPRQNFSF